MSNSAIATPQFQAKASSVQNADGTSLAQKVVTGMVVTDSPMMYRNKVHNGAMTVSQKYGAGDATYTAANIASGAAPFWTIDRFAVRFFGTNYTAGDVATATQTTDAPPGFTNSLKVTAKQNVSFAGGRLASFINHTIEGIDVASFNLGTANAIQATLSFWVKASKIGTMSVAFENYAADRSYGTTVSIFQANTWERKTVTLQLDTQGSWYRNNERGLSITFGIGSDGSWLVSSPNVWSSTRAIFNSAQTNFVSTTNDYVAITGVQLEAGTVATPFEHKLFADDLRLCQRYFYSLPSFGQLLGTGVCVGNYLLASWGHPVVMRTTPTATFLGTDSGAWFTTSDDTTYGNYGSLTVRTIYDKQIGVRATLVSGTNGLSGIVYIQSGRSIWISAEI